MVTPEKVKFHLDDIDNALSDMEAGLAGNDAHQRAIKAIAKAVQFLLVEAKSNSKV